MSDERTSKRSDDRSTWPDELHRLIESSGVVESVVTTRGPNDRWNVAALGLHAGDPVTARTWGNTRTRRNFDREGGGYVQFTRDPVEFVDAALSIVECDSPILDSVDAWVEVTVEQVDEGATDGTDWVDWALSPIESRVERRTVPTIDRGHAAVIEATVAASRLDVPSYDSGTLVARLRYFESVVEACGGDRDCEAFDRLCEHVDWRSADES